MVGFNEKDAKRVAAATRIVEKLPKNQGGERRRPNNAPGSIWARITGNEGKRYSWEQLLPATDDTLEGDEEGNLLAGSHEADTGYAIEASESTSVPEDTIVRLYPGLSEDYYVFEYTAANPIVHFELTESMSFGGSALAHNLKYSTGSWSIDEEAAPIRVYDWWGDMWAGAEEYRGLAVSRGDSSSEVIEGEDEESESVDVGKYDVIWMERIASYIEFTLTEYMGEDDPGEAQATVSDYDHQGHDPGSTVDVYDKQDMFKDAHEGAKGKALYHHHDEEYRVISCQRLAMFATASLDADCCGSTPLLKSFNVIAIGDYVGSPEDDPSSAQNPRGHAGVENDTVLLMRITDTLPNPEWAVVDIKKHSTQIITDVRVDADNKKLQKKKRTVYLEWCDSTTPEWEDYHTGTNCDTEEE